MPEFVQITKARKRYVFGRNINVAEMPDMIQVQRDSYHWFYQDNISPDERKSQGLQELLEEIFPIESFDKQYSLEFVKYTINSPDKWDDRYVKTEEEARQKDITWARPINATIRLTKKDGSSKEDKEIFLGDFPIMTDRGTFIINGTERVVINQLARSAGIYFTRTSYGCSAKLIPERGAWLDFAFEPDEIVSVSFDNRKKLPVTLLLKALGMKDNAEIIEKFGYQVKIMEISDELKGKISVENISDSDGRIIVAAGRPITAENLNELYDNSDPDKFEGVKVYDMPDSMAFAFKDSTRNPDEAKIEIFKR